MTLHSVTMCAVHIMAYRSGLGSIFSHKFSAEILGEVPHMFNTQVNAGEREWSVMTPLEEIAVTGVSKRYSGPWAPTTCLTLTGIEKAAL